MECPDFSHAFCTWRLREQASYGRFTIEAILFNPVDGTRFFLLSGVMAAHVYGSGRLVSDPPYEFLAVFGPETYRVFRTHAPFDPTQDTIMPIQDRFESVAIHLMQGIGEPLDSIEAIIRATLAPAALMTKVTLESGLQLLFPIKHMNVQTDTGQFQAETGPILMPNDLTTARLERLLPAYIVFNRLDQAEVVLRQSVQTGNVLNRHYGDWRSFPAQIQILSLPS
jgi:hypothetical protein